MKFKFFGHSFLKVSFPGTNILVDPFRATNPDSAVSSLIHKPIFLKRDLKDIDLILISNDAFDHFDKTFVEEIANDNSALVISHESILNQLDISRSQKFKVFSDSECVLKNVKIKSVPIHCPTSFYPLGFHLSSDNTSLFYAGSSGLMDSFGDISADVAVLPIGGSTSMDVVDAVRVIKMMKPKYAIPIRYNSFSHLSADPLEFTRKIKKSILETIPVILNNGEEWALPLEIKN